MLTNLFIIFSGLALLLGGGTLLIPGTIGLAKRFNIPARIVAFVIVAGGTSAPELLVSVNAVLQDSPGIAWGNLLGSNLANSLLVLGLGALAAPIITSDSLTRWDLKFLLLISLFIFSILGFGLYAGRAGIAISLILIASYLLYLLRMLRLQKGEPEIDEMPEKRSWKTAFFYTFGGIAALIFGAELFVSGGIALARLSGWSEAFIGLTIIAIGTSLPEIVSVGASILHKRGDIALANVMGSNLFNLLIALGGAGLFGSLVIDMQLVLLPMILMLLVCAILLIFSYHEKAISTRWGVVFIGFYLCFLGLESIMSAA
jgi:cation:H+ antiporter